MEQNAVLDINEKQKTQYAVPMWLRDLQIQQACERIKDRIQGPLPARQDPIAIVCYGPSLADTWEKVRDFKYVFTGSGSHKFMIDRGIIPTWHADVDPRPHKVTLMGTPHPDVEYLIASTCSPKLFDHLEGFNVKLWHIFDTSEEGLRVLPRGEWALTGGQNVGMRQMTLAAFLGFRELHIFGMDGCAGKTGKHAAEHPMQAKKSAITTYGGVEYRTTPAFLECAKQTFNELDQMPGVNATFYGDGLVQAMAKKYVRKKIDNPLVFFNKPETISAAYIEQNALLHRQNLTYGSGGGKHAERILKMVEAIKEQSAKEGKPILAPSVLDYGAGKGLLAKALPFPIWEYDPAVPGKQEPPRPADLCVSTDVLEHVEPDKLPIVLDDLRRCTRLVGFFAIHTGAAKKTLPDGRNAHLIQENEEWWAKQIRNYFHITKIIQAGKERYFVVHAKEGKTATHVAGV